jgi:hypothetical protein
MLSGYTILFGHDMSKRLNPAIAFATLSFVALTGCNRQPKPQPLVPPPMIPQSAMLPLPVPLEPETGKPAVVAPAPPVTATASKPKGRPRNPHKISDLKPAPTAATATPTPPSPPVETTPAPKITASGDAPGSATISEGLPHSDEIYRKQTAAQLNQSTEDTLRSITRPLTPSEKSVVEQIRSFIAQSQEAIADNDAVRAHNLALKAHLLSDELAHR